MYDMGMVGYNIEAVQEDRDSARDSSYGIRLPHIQIIRTTLLF